MSKIEKEKNKFDNINTEELEKKLKTKKIINKLIIGFWIVGFILYAYFGLIKDYEIDNTLIVIWCFSIIVGFSNGITLDKIKKNLNKRGNKHSS